MVAAIPLSASAANNKYVKSLKLSKSSVTVSVGKSTKVTATVKAKGSVSKSVSVKSANTKIATAKAGAAKSGKTAVTIAGKSKGTTKVTIKTKAKNKGNKTMSKTVSVRVNSSSSESQDSGVKLTATELSVVVGQRAELILYKNGENINFSAIWSSSDNSICDVSSITVTDKIYGAAIGDAVVTAKYGGKTYKCTVHVTDKSAVTYDNPATGFNWATDGKVEYGTKETYVEFQFNSDEVSADELRSA